MAKLTEYQKKLKYLGIDKFEYEKIVADPKAWKALQQRIKNLK